MIQTFTLICMFLQMRCIHHQLKHVNICWLTISLAIHKLIDIFHWHDFYSGIFATVFDCIYDDFFKHWKKPLQLILYASNILYLKKKLNFKRKFAKVRDKIIRLEKMKLTSVESQEWLRIRLRSKIKTISNKLHAAKRFAA